MESGYIHVEDETFIDKIWECGYCKKSKSSDDFNMKFERVQFGPSKLMRSNICRKCATDLCNTLLSSI